MDDLDSIPVFELRNFENNTHIKIYANGRVDGAPENTIVINRIQSRERALLGGSRRLKPMVITHEERWAFAWRPIRSYNRWFWLFYKTGSLTVID